MGGDVIAAVAAVIVTLFQSTPPGWEATYSYLGRAYTPDISIHASRMGGDPLRSG